MNKYGHVLTVDEAAGTVDWISRIRAEERDLVIEARPLEAAAFVVGGIRFAYVFYESGLAINSAR